MHQFPAISELDVSCRFLHDQVMTDSNWERLATAVINRRAELGMRTTKALADRAGMTARALGDLENHRRANFSKSTLATIEIALAWAPGSIDAVLGGGEPTLAGRTGESGLGAWSADPDVLAELALAADRLRDEANWLVRFTANDDIADVLRGATNTAELSYELAEKVEQVAQLGVGGRTHLARLKIALQQDRGEFRERAHEMGRRVTDISSFRQVAAEPPFVLRDDRQDPPPPLDDEQLAAYKPKLGGKGSREAQEQDELADRPDPEGPEEGA